jgi:hypothetical protein
VSDRVTRRRVLAGLSTGLVVGLAGCGTSDPDSDDDGGGTPTDEGTADTATETEDDGGTPTDGDEGDTDTPTATPSPEAGGALDGMTSRVEELEIVSAEQDVADEGDPSPTGTWLLHLGVRNTGEQETDVMEYAYDGTLYDAEGNGLARTSGKSGGDESIAPPGEVGDLTLTVPAEEVDPDAVARVEVTIACAAIWDGVYCEDA